ncbi:sensor histidine kinase [Pseudoalteromonas pernae]|uniref:sensor histidine kinase n=1 Tax=Pseudoalteromonas pernae TaxID=3118054 RepID=UPI0032429E6D
MQAQLHDHQRAIDYLHIAKNEFLLNHDVTSLKSLEEHIAYYWQHQIMLSQNTVNDTEKLLVEEVTNSVQTYIDQLNELKALLRRLGLSENQGLTGEFRKQIHKLQAIANKGEDTYLNTQILEMRRREKDFLLRFDDQYLELHRRHYDNVITHLQQLGDKEQIELISQYGQLFADVIAAYNLLGVHQDEGLRLQMTLQELKTETASQKLALGYTQNRIDDALMANASALTLVAVIALLLLVFLHLLSARVSNSLAKLHGQIAKVMNEEDFSFRTGLQGKDEIALLGRDIDQLFAFIEELLQRLGEAQEKLIEEAKMASLGSMVSGFAHELNTPIGVAITSHSVLKDQFLLLKTDFQTGQLKKHTLTNLINNAERSLALLESNLYRSAQLIDTFKLMSAHNDSNLEVKFAVKSTIENVLASLQSEVDAAQASFIVDADEQLTITASVSAFTQIITCCVRNCLLHASQEENRLEVAIRVTSENGVVHLYIDDNGPGIEDVIKAKAFEPFITTKRNEGGTGIGLAIVYNLVRTTLKGQITLQNLRPKGLSVHISFIPSKVNS